MDLVVGGGPDSIAVPDLIGLDENEARSHAGAGGFTSVNTREVDSLDDEGKVVDRRSAEGEQSAPNGRSPSRSPPARSRCPT